VLQVLHVNMYLGTAQFLDSIPSSSVSLIHFNHSFLWGYESLKKITRFPAAHKPELEKFAVLGASIRKIAQRYSSRHPGSKTRVQTNLNLNESEIRDFENGEILSYKAKLQEALGNHVDLELIFDSLMVRSDPDAGTYRLHAVPIP